MPARKPLRQSSLGDSGHRMSSSTRSTCAPVGVRIAWLGPRAPAAALNAKAPVAAPNPARKVSVRRSASQSASAESGHVVRPRSAVRGDVGPAVQVPVAPDDAADVTAAVVGRVRRRDGEAARAQERAAIREVRTPPVAGDVLPAALGEKAVVAARDDPRPILERDAEGRLDRRPVGEDLGRDAAAVATPKLGAHDRVPGREVRERSRAAVGQEDRRVARGAVDARVRAAAVRVDRPAERHPRALGHPVERGPRADLVEAHVERLGRVEVPHHGRLAVAGQRRALLCFDRQVVPAHEHMFAERPDGPESVRPARSRAATPRPRASCSSRW